MAQAATLIAFVPSLPAYFLACDFGRWLSIAFTILLMQLCCKSYLLALADGIDPLRSHLLRLDAWLPFTSASRARALLAIATPFLMLPHGSNPPVLLTLRAPAFWLL